MRIRDDEVYFLPAGSSAPCFSIFPWFLLAFSYSSGSMIAVFERKDKKERLPKDEKDQAVRYSILETNFRLVNRCIRKEWDCKGEIVETVVFPFDCEGGSINLTRWMWWALRNVEQLLDRNEDSITKGCVRLWQGEKERGRDKRT